MTKVISYSDFLKEGALKEQRPEVVLQTAEKETPFRLVPEDIVTDAEEKAFWKRLRHFFRTGEGPESAKGVNVPALIAPYLRHGNWDTEYPFYLAQESATSQSLENLINSTFDTLFTASEAKVLNKNLVRLKLLFKDCVKDGIVEFAEAKEVACKNLLKIEVHDEEGERFKNQVEGLKLALPIEGHIIDFHHEVALHLIRQKLQQIEWNRKQYKQKIKDIKLALEELLTLEKNKSGKEQPEKGFEFASDMIAFKKVEEMIPREQNSLISVERLNRINGILEVLRLPLDNDENVAHLIIDEKLKEHYSWKDIFTTSKLSFVPLEKAFDKAEAIFDKNIATFTKVHVAIRKAELELQDAYNPDVHDDYFNHFRWFKLDEQELTIFPPVMLFAESAELIADRMSAFSSLMAKNKPVKVVALMDRTVNPTQQNVDWEEASHGFRQELAASALAQRNMHTLQCAADRPFGLLNGIRAGMSSIAPALMHLLVPSAEDEPLISFLKINAAAAGRYFPYVMYDPHKGVEWGSRFDVLDNSQPENDWPIYPFEFAAAEGDMQTMNLAFTYADYKAMNMAKVQELFIVPEAMVNDFLVPIEAYLKLPQTEQTGKVPFIWLVNEENVLVRAAVPYMWVSSCQERLEFWSFIQEIGGVNNYHVKHSIEEAKAAWEKAKQQEMDDLKANFEEELRKAKRESAGVAMDKLASVLLNLDHLPTTSNKPIAKQTETIIKEEVKASDEEIEETNVKEEDVAEAWIETFRCTSCNDCTDKYPAIFDYNEDKQAFIKNASGGTFEHIVMAAEGCPAACIHPGAPLNPNEANLEELIQRAAKFN